MTKSKPGETIMFKIMVLKVWSPGNLLEMQTGLLNNTLCRPSDTSGACSSLRSTDSGRVEEDVFVKITETELLAEW